MLPAALERAIHREVERQQRFLVPRYFRRREDSRSRTEGRLDGKGKAKLFPHPGLKCVGTGGRDREGGRAWVSSAVDAKCGQDPNTRVSGTSFNTELR